MEIYLKTTYNFRNADTTPIINKLDLEIINSKGGYPSMIRNNEWYNFDVVKNLVNDGYHYGDYVDISLIDREEYLIYIIE